MLQPANRKVHLAGTLLVLVALTPPVPPQLAQPADGATF